VATVDQGRHATETNCWNKLIVVAGTVDSTTEVSASNVAGWIAE